MAKAKKTSERSGEAEEEVDLLRQKLDALPKGPGVYMFRDAKNVVIYVGKAKSLRPRVRSYFQDGSSDERALMPWLRRYAVDLDTIVVASEKEALILENSLIKQHQPRYNIRLRDDKDYLSLRISVRDQWARLYVVRRATQDGAKYFGPYHSATAARRTLHLVNKHFQLRTCTDAELKRRKRPCLQYQIKRCPAPCVFEVSSDWYAEQVDAVTKFLDGRHDELSRELDDRMKNAARAMSFELAAVYRDQLAAIDAVRQAQRVVTVDDVDRDVIGLYREGEGVEIALLHVRSGRLSDVATFSLPHTELPDDEIIGAFLSQHYHRDPPAEGEAEGFVPVPNEILVPVMPEAAEGVGEYLAETAGRSVSLVLPERGQKADLLRMATENAKHAYFEKRRAADDVVERLQQMQQKLRLPTVPRRIECCDISHLGGGDTVGAIVALTDGEPDKKRYRTFHVRFAMAAEAKALRDSERPPVDLAARAITAVEEAQNAAALGDDPPATAAEVARLGDDYAAMYEVLARRFRRGRDQAEAASTPAGTPDTDAPTAAVPDVGDADPESAAPWELPDLFVVDGGKGQLNVALAAAHDLGLHELAIVSLAKEKENVLGEMLVDRVYLPGQKNPIPLRGNPSLFYLARARDEAHRFSNRGREKLGKRKRFKSKLDDVKGIGPTSKKRLLRELGSLTAIRAATDEALLAVEGISARHVKALRAAFGPGNDSPGAEEKTDPPTPGADTGSADANKK